MRATLRTACRAATEMLGRKRSRLGSTHSGHGELYHGRLPMRRSDSARGQFFPGYFLHRETLSTLANARTNPDASDPHARPTIPSAASRPGFDRSSMERQARAATASGSQTRARRWMRRSARWRSDPSRAVLHAPSSRAQRWARAARCPGMRSGHRIDPLLAPPPRSKVRKRPLGLNPAEVWPSVQRVVRRECPCSSPRIEAVRSTRQRLRRA